MTKAIFLTIIGFLLFNYTFGQDLEKYSELVKEAWGLYKTKAYKKSARKYSAAFTALGNKGQPMDRYNAACSWALAEEIDSSFVQLFIVAEKGNYTNYNHLSSDPDLSTLHSDKRWNEVLNVVKANKEKAEANLNKPLVAMLDTIYQEDQGLRRKIRDVEEKYGRDSDEMKAHWKTISEKDSINLIKIQHLLDEHGWLGADSIGNQGNMTLFLVIQHADIETQVKYLPMMREAVQNGNAQASSLALVEDRVALRKGEKQIYGSQVGRDQETGDYYVLPLVDPDHVDQRRAAVGLDPIQDYLSSWGMTWDAEEYKKYLPEIETKQRK